MAEPPKENDENMETRKAVSYAKEWSDLAESIRVLTSAALLFFYFFMICFWIL